MDVVKLLLLLRLDVLVLLHPAGVLHVGPVGRQHHQVVDLWVEGNDRVTIIIIIRTPCFVFQLPNVDIIIHLLSFGDCK